MNSIPTSSATAFSAPLPAAASTAAPDAGGGDLLGAMRPAMDQASHVGIPTNAAGASAILATGGSYVQGANATLAKLDQGIAKRHAEVDRLRLSDPGAAKDKQQQLDLLERLRDRIQLSIERVSDILAGKDRDDIGSPEGAAKPATHAKRTRDEDLELLEQRRRLLAPAVSAPVAPTMVAGTYAAGTS